MPRRKSNSFMDDVSALFMIGPAWVPGVIAVVVYVAIRGFVGHTLALTVCAVICVMGLRAIFHRQSRRILLDRQNDLEAIRSLTWRQFEMLVGEAYRRKGYTVHETGGGPDGGVDLVLKRDGETVLVQCKHWKAHTVGVPVAREVYGVLMSEKATRAIIVTSGEFTADARDFAERKPLALVNGAGLLALVQGVSAKPTTKMPVPDAPDAPPACPSCQSPMILRTSRQGKNVGGQFWGCPRFPHCRGTRQL